MKRFFALALLGFVAFAADDEIDLGEALAGLDGLEEKFGLIMEGGVAMTESALSMSTDEMAKHSAYLDGMGEDKTQEKNDLLIAYAK